MITQTAKVTNAAGLHARPAAVFVKEANKYQAKITVRYNQKTVNAKSLLSILTLGADQGTTIEIAADGADEQAALTALLAVLDTKFD